MAGPGLSQFSIYSTESTMSDGEDGTVVEDSVDSDSTMVPSPSILCGLSMLRQTRSQRQPASQVPKEKDSSRECCQAENSSDSDESLALVTQRSIFQCANNVAIGRGGQCIRQGWSRTHDDVNQRSPELSCPPKLRKLADTESSHHDRDSQAGNSKHSQYERAREESVSKGNSQSSICSSERNTWQEKHIHSQKDKQSRKRNNQSSRAEQVVSQAQDIQKSSENREHLAEGDDVITGNVTDACQGSDRSSNQSKDGLDGGTEIGENCITNEGRDIPSDKDEDRVVEIEKLQNSVQELLKESKSTDLIKTKMMTIQHALKTLSEENKRNKAEIARQQSQCSNPGVSMELRHNLVSLAGRQRKLLQLLQRQKQLSCQFQEVIGTGQKTSSDGRSAESQPRLRESGHEGQTLGDNSKKLAERGNNDGTYGSGNQIICRVDSMEPGGVKSLDPVSENDGRKRKRGRQRRKEIAMKQTAKERDNETVNRDLDTQMNLDMAQQHASTAVRNSKNDVPGVSYAVTENAQKSQHVPRDMQRSATKKVLSSTFATPVSSSTHDDVRTESQRFAGKGHLDRNSQATGSGAASRNVTLKTLPSLCTVPSIVRYHSPLSASVNQQHTPSSDVRTAPGVTTALPLLGSSATKSFYTTATVVACGDAAASTMTSLPSTSVTKTAAATGLLCSNAPVRDAPPTTGNVHQFPVGRGNPGQRPLSTTLSSVGAGIPRSTTCGKIPPSTVTQSSMPVTASQEVSAGKTRQKKQTLFSLIETKVIQPGDNVLSITNQNKTFYGDLLSSGTIQINRGQCYSNPSQWFKAVFKRTRVSKACAWREVKYKGTPLEVYGGCVANTSCSQDERESSQCLEDSQVSTQDIHATHQQDHHVLSSTSDDFLTNMFHKCKINLIDDDELVNWRSVLPSDFWENSNASVPRHWLQEF
ncbi:uncharacterized protein [Ptychodera flava]|uniref:uncharacterized protein n=1 Tax=Ptychodera flava TaxID=63121 RepID=UPI00396A8BFA